MIFDPRAFLKDLFGVAVAAAEPAKVIGGHLPPKISGRTVVIGAGKASAAMAAAFETAWILADRGPLEGLVVTRYGHGHPCRMIEIVEAGHPIPDDSSMAAARRILELVSNLSAGDQVVALISGGGSALLSLPPDDVAAEVKRVVNRILLATGASIREMNCIRKHLSQVKGGRLARAAHPAKVRTLIISDIPGDEAALVASGPTLADETNRLDALAIVDRYQMKLPVEALAFLKDPTADAPKPDDPDFADDSHVILASAQTSLEAAAAFARKAGLPAYILSDSIEGEARDIGLMHAALVRQVVHKSQPFQRPCLLLSGGETTVTLRSKEGRGGRNAEFLLAFAQGIAGLEAVTALAADTDGIDGSETNAGAICDGQSAGRLIALGRSPAAYLDFNDAYTAFAALGDLVVTGPTRTNVNDFRVILID